ncbi:fumarate reductase subunit C [Tardiphaga sp.]|jgi:fumarate reductase subunit C|uniref:fumarate reductase subunit C n=1 Tax=Tardiphaga sp. TaxID=1926292 RepID=UPI0025E5A1F3|nr:fumarate reductase subunit C [Tardiphaga sp.]
MSERRPFHRVQSRTWWARKPYLAYTLREMTGVAVALYGASLLAALVCLWRGPETFEAYRRVVASDAALLVHLILLAAVLWHVITWFQILPKTMPKLILGGQLIPPSRVTAVALLFAGACSIGLLAAVIMIGVLS